ncbi:hypothetical protein K488DRAFT_87040 [Vararia minispora EC-137]|uniref:Uncharacterized protein n=1 Tax=Vararia minispora EC-137 TaxID=1314806 RepID=A0ACB8QHI6_9AGAM|nr:hypothetical protein K488DRAFT_87040 [Vararia minispora EC-137]
MRISPAHFAKRQAGAVSVPTAAGVGAVQTASAGNAATGGSLLLGTNTASATESITAGFIAGGGSVTVTSGSSFTPSTPAPTITSASGHGTVSQSSGGLSTGALIGIIVAAFAGLVLVIFFVYSALRRHWAKSLGKRSPRSLSGGARSSLNARNQPWSKLDDRQDRWEGQEKKQDPDGEVNRLSLFRKASSTRSGTEEKSTAPHEFDPSTMPNFAKYHPELAADFATAAPIRPFAAHLDESKTVSWDGETVGGDSFLSLRLSDSSAMSPGAAVKQTPPAISSVLHRWQSAEVLTMDEPEAADSAADAVVANPFADEVFRKSGGGGSNPFFSSHPGSTDPFADPQRHKDSTPPMQRPDSPDSVETVRASPARPDSTTRPESNSQAMQSLLAVLDASEDEPRSQRASLQPSMVSSQYPDTERNSMASFVTYTPKAM